MAPRKKASSTTSNPTKHRSDEDHAPRHRKRVVQHLPLAKIATQPGRVYVFGTGDCAQLGLGEDVTIRKKPANLVALNDQHIVDIAAGKFIKKCAFLRVVVLVKKSLF